MWRMTGYSRVMPLAPSTWRALRATSSAARTLPSLPMLTCSGRRRPSSFMRPSCSAEQRGAVDLERHHRQLCCWSWNDAIGLSNASARGCSRAPPRSRRAPRRRRPRRCRSGPRSGTTAAPAARSPSGSIALGGQPHVVEQRARRSPTRAARACGGCPGVVKPFVPARHEEAADALVGLRPRRPRRRRSSRW